MGTMIGLKYMREIGMAGWAALVVVGFASKSNAIGPQQIAAALAPPAFPHAFEPVSPNAIGRFWGVGPGRGFHVVPMGPYQARFHHGVTAGGMPYEEDYHPNHFGKLLNPTYQEQVAGGWQHIPAMSTPTSSGRSWNMFPPTHPPLPSDRRIPGTTKGSSSQLRQPAPPALPRNPKTPQLPAQPPQPQAESLPSPPDQKQKEKGWSDTDPALSPDALDKLFETERNPAEEYEEPRTR